VVLAQGRLRAADTSAERWTQPARRWRWRLARVEQTVAALAQAELDWSYTTVKAARRG